MVSRANYGLYVVFAILFVFAFAELIILMYTNTPAEPRHVKFGLTPNELIYQQASKAFIDQDAINLMYATMKNITLGCTPVVSAPINGYLNFGTVSQTTNSFQMLKTWLATPVSGQPYCVMYGVSLADVRVGYHSGVVDVCYGYMFAGLQVVALNYNYTVPPTSVLETTVNTAWPLTLYWRQNTQYGSTTAVVSSLIVWIKNYISTRNATSSAQGFCNQYFAQNTLTYWNPDFLPWFGFWAPPVVNRVSQNSVPQLLSNSIQNFQIGAADNVTRIKAVYILGSTCDQQPACLQFIRSAVSHATVYRMSDSNIAAQLDAITNSLYQTSGNTALLNGSLVPVLVIGHYDSDSSAFDAYVAPQFSVLFAFTVLSSDLQTQSSQARNVDAFALSNTVMSFMDYSSSIYLKNEFDNAFGTQFLVAKQVADFFVSVSQIGLIAEIYGTLYLLPTFAVKNMLVNGVDVGGDLTRIQLQQQAAALGYGTGLFIEPYSYTFNYTYNNVDDVSVGGASVQIPETYNFLDQYPGVDSQLKSYPELSQKSCNNCWARASTISVSWRCYKKQGGGDYSKCSLSPQHVLTCSYLDNGCLPQPAATGFGSMGNPIPFRTCMPDIYQGSKAPSCPKSCNGPGNFKTLGGVVPGSLQKLRDTASIKREMYLNGPVMLTFQIPADFYTFFTTGKKNANVYAPTKYTTLGGGHAVMCYGYGPNYFMCQNSWGENWNGDGRFLVEADNAVYSGRSTWFNNFGYTAEYKAGAVYPDAAATYPLDVQDPINGDVTQVTPEPANPIMNPNCAQVVINQTQTLENAGIEGCPTNKKKSTSGGGGASATLPGTHLTLLVFLVVLAGLVF